jgi:2-polyprenyl-3-methyl-5-hydroxy-6-metoxy-1,4-benzoquinol methylase
MPASELRPLPEFTGERVVPGLVDADLYNEHFARYAFATRLAAGRRVLDAGCGSGYGSAELARVAGAVTAIDFSEDAISFARQNFQAANLGYEVGDCLSLPQGPFDLIVAFEVIEHLTDWRGFLAEAKRALAPGGLFLVSTPNKLYYAESRGQSGENLFHVHEFEYAEFDAELKSFFPHVGMFVQNHVEGIAFTPLEGGGGFESPVDAAIGANGEAPEKAHFYLAVCGFHPLPPTRAFVWVPGTGNILREREHHIGLLAGEVALKKAELDERHREYACLLEMFRDLNAQMEERNRWAIEARAEADERLARIVELQEELAREQMNFGRIAAGYEAKVSELEEVNRAKTEWAIETERRLTQEIHERSEELALCVELLDRAEQTVVERTHWAQDLQRELSDLQTRLAELRATNWVKVGSKLKLVPEQR